MAVMHSARLCAVRGCRLDAARMNAGVVGIGCHHALLIMHVIVQGSTQGESLEPQVAVGVGSMAR